MAAAEGETASGEPSSETAEASEVDGATGAAVSTESDGAEPAVEKKSNPFGWSRVEVAPALSQADLDKQARLKVRQEAARGGLRKW